uniref:Uncharacterized protein n=1 Tax=Biomphalaria glabrata TaxID=6526 RepID=A0A2C9LPP4_BIOGL
MYYRKGTDQHLTFLRNMREAHAMYPFTGKRDKELFDKALAELCVRMPFLRADIDRLTARILHVCCSKINMRAHRLRARESKLPLSLPLVVIFSYYNDSTSSYSYQVLRLVSFLCVTSKCTYRMLSFANVDID